MCLEDIGNYRGLGVHLSRANRLASTYSSARRVAGKSLCQAPQGILSFVHCVRRGFAPGAGLQWSLGFALVQSLQALRFRVSFESLPVQAYVT